MLDVECWMLDVEPLTHLSAFTPAVYVPGGAKFLEVSSRTRTQSLFLPLLGGVKVRSPVLSNSPIWVALPVRGSYHQAVTWSPESLFRRTVTGLPQEV